MGLKSVIECDLCGKTGTFNEGCRITHERFFLNNQLSDNKYITFYFCKDCYPPKKEEQDRQELIPEARKTMGKKIMDILKGK